MYKHPKAAGRAIGPRRRLSSLFGICAIILFTVLPLTLMVSELMRPCPEVLLDIAPTWWQRVNPLSQYNLCHVQDDIAPEHPTLPRLHTISDSAGGPIQPTQQQQPGAVQPQGAAQLGLASQVADVAQKDPERREQERQAAEEHKRQVQLQAHKDQEQQRAAARLAESVRKQRAQEAEEEERRLKAAAAEKQKEEEQQRAAKAEEEAEAKQAVHDSGELLSLGAGHDSIDSGVELPRTAEDVERILTYPHFDECNLCKVCVPMDVVAHHPKARAHPKARLIHVAQSEDDDVKLDVTRPATSTAAPARSLLQRQPHIQKQTSRKLSQQQLLQGDDEIDDSTALPSDGIYRVKGKEIDISDIAPGDTKAKARMDLPNCTMCWGCSHTLEPMASGTVMAGSYYAHEPGGSPSWLFRVRSARARSGWAVVKVWCVPVRKSKQRGLAMCIPDKVYAQVKLLLAQQKVVHECGLNSVIPSLWVEPVRGVIPGHGFRVDWLGLWADVADGLSVQNIQEAGNPKTSPDMLLDLLQQRLNHTALKQVAIFDVMFSQCDRHQQNLFITEQGNIWAIDNDQVSGTAWRQCGFDSIVLPTTQKFMINHVGYFYVMKYPQKDPPTSPIAVINPLLLLDYRCHVDGREIGFNYPPALSSCLRQLSSLTSKQIQDQYGYPTRVMSAALRNRSADLLARGFEWTLLHGQPANQPSHRYKMAPACCKMSFDKATQKYQCDEPGWSQMKDLPYGNPWHGGSWHGTASKDTGSYEGGTVFQ